MDERERTVQVAQLRDCSILMISTTRRAAGTARAPKAPATASVESCIARASCSSGNRPSTRLQLKHVNKGRGMITSNEPSEVPCLRLSVHRHAFQSILEVGNRNLVVDEIVTTSKRSLNTHILEGLPEDTSKHISDPCFVLLG